MAREADELTPARGGAAPEEKRSAIADLDRELEEVQKRLVTVSDGKIVPKKKHEPIVAVTAAELEQMDIPPIEWLVEGLLPVGLSMIGAPAKYYKSYMALQLCVEICTGGNFLGYQCHQNACMYFDLESTKRRPKMRLRQILGERPAPDNLFILTGTDDIGLIGDGFEGQMEEQLFQHPEIKLVIVDVFQKIRQAAKRSQSGYDRDYDDLKALKDIADNHGIGIMLIHHTRKMRDDADVFNELSGSVGVMGALDAAWVITRSKRDEEDSILHVTGRDLEAVNLQLQFDTRSFQWRSYGTAEDVQARRELEEYEASPIINSVRKLVSQNDGEWRGSVDDIKSASRYLGAQIFDDVSTIGKKVRNFEALLWAVDKIQFEELRKGKDRKRIIHFYRIDK